MDVVEERFVFGELALSVERPADPGALVDEARFAEDEYMPYWAEVWPAGVELARLVAGLELAGTRVLELGCGLGLPSIVAALRGATVTATDWAPEAIRALRTNAARNGARLDARVVDWGEEGALEGARFDLVLAADVLYEERNAQPLVQLVAATLADAGEAIFADPGRRHAWRLDELVREAGLVADPLPHALATTGARVTRLRRPGR